MNVYDFIAQYSLVVLFTLSVAHRHLFPMMCDGNIEPIIRKLDEMAEEAQWWLDRMSPPGS